MNTASHFDNAAAEWDHNAERHQFLMGLVHKLLEKLDLSPEMTLIDYGCGTGNASLPIAPKVSHIYALDTSEGMLAELKDKLEDQNINNVTPLFLNLSENKFPHSKVDAAFSIMTMHHVPDTDALLDNLTAALKPGGMIFLLDLYSEDGCFHQGMEPVPHLGFDPDKICSKLKVRGCENCQHELAGIKRREHGDYPVFIISARISK